MSIDPTSSFVTARDSMMVELKPVMISPMIAGAAMSLSSVSVISNGLRLRKLAP